MGTIVLMLVFALNAAGEAGTGALKFDTLRQCEDARGVVTAQLIDPNLPKDRQAIYVATAGTVAKKVDSA